MANSTLVAIRKKVRLITGSPAPTQLSDAEIDEYVNTFILYDLPQELRLFSLHRTLTFYTQPYVDTYGTTAVVTDNLYNFKNRYMTVQPPVYCAGNPANFTQDRDSFYNSYPQLNSILHTNQFGNGILTTFTGTASSVPLLASSVSFTAINSAGAGMIVVDYPVSNTTGALGLQNQPQVLPSPYGQIDYVTGSYTVVFPAAVGTSQEVLITGINYKPSRPQTMLFYDGHMVLRPVPDDVYTIQIEANARPTELLLATDSPDLEQWWQYIALGATKKVFEDRLDYESITMIMPSLDEQKIMALSTSIIQQTNVRTETFFTKGTSFHGYWGPFGGHF